MIIKKLTKWILASGIAVSSFYSLAQDLECRIKQRVGAKTVGHYEMYDVKSVSIQDRLGSPKVFLNFKDNSRENFNETTGGYVEVSSFNNHIAVLNDADQPELAIDLKGESQYGTYLGTMKISLDHSQFYALSCKIKS